MKGQKKENAYRSIKKIFICKYINKLKEKKVEYVNTKKNANNIKRLALSLFFYLLILSTNICIASEIKELTYKEEEIKIIIRDFILNNPEIISEALYILQERQKNEEELIKKQTVSQINNQFKESEIKTFIGNPEGKINIIEFFDYNCGFCKSMFSIIAEAINTNKDVCLILIELPILGEESIIASRAALASSYQDMYSEFHQALMSNKGLLTKEKIFSIADNIGIDIIKLKKDMDRKEINNKIESNFNLARKLKIDGTPAFYFKNKFIYGAIDEKEFFELVDNIRNSEYKEK